MSPQELVTPAWIKDQMNDLGIKSKVIAAENGLDKTNISAWINGKRPMSNVVKAFFFFYFKRKKKERVIEGLVKQVDEANLAALKQKYGQAKSGTNKQVI